MTTGPFVLRETLASRQQGKPIFFREMTGIGPACTAALAEAATFPTEEAAKRSPAYSFSLTSFEPEPLSAHQAAGVNP